jgi:hypothetical protein
MRVIVVILKQDEQDATNYRPITERDELHERAWIRVQTQTLKHAYTSLDPCVLNLFIFLNYCLIACTPATYSRSDNQ